MTKIRVLHEYLFKDMENIITVFSSKEECKKACTRLIEYYEEQWNEPVTGEWDDFYIPDRVEVQVYEQAINTADDFIQKLQ